MLKAGNGLVGLQAKVLATSPSDVQAWSALSGKARELRHIFSGALFQITGSLGMLELEVSYGRISAKDLKLLIEKSKVLVGRLMGIASFQVRNWLRTPALSAYNGQCPYAQLIVGEAKKIEDSRGSESAAYDGKTVDRLYKMQNLITEKEQSSNRTVNRLLPILQQSSARLRTACHGGLQGGIEWLEWTNTHRWSRGNKAYPEGESIQEGLQKRRLAIEELRDALEEFRNVEHIKLLEPFRELFDPETGDFKEHPDNLSDADAFRLSSRSLFTSFVFVTNLISYSTTLIDFLQTLLEVEARSPKNKMQWPTALRKIAKIAMSRGGSTMNPLEIGTQDVDAESDRDSDDEDDGASSTRTLVEDKQNKAKEQKRQKTEERRRKKYRVDPDAEQPRNGFQRGLRTIGVAWRWQSSPEGLFALKYSLVSIALWIPAICPSSAYFTYVNRGLW